MPEGSFNASPSRDFIFRTYCNPLPIPDYPRGKSCRQPDCCHDFRELADPSVLYHEGQWYLYPSCGMAWVSEDFVTWQHRKMNLYDLGYAPTIVAHRGAFYLTASSTPTTARQRRLARGKRWARRWEPTASPCPASPTR